jgi:hypothetical protein
MLHVLLSNPFENNYRRHSSEPGHEIFKATKPNAMAHPGTIASCIVCSGDRDIGEYYFLSMERKEGLK